MKGCVENLRSLLVVHVQWNRDIAHFVVEYKPLCDATGAARRAPLQSAYGAVIDTEGTLVCLCVYRKGAAEVVRRLQQVLTEQTKLKRIKP